MPLLVKGIHFVAERAIAKCYPGRGPCRDVTATETNTDIVDVERTTSSVPISTKVLLELT